MPTVYISRRQIQALREIVGISSDQIESCSEPDHYLIAEIEHANKFINKFRGK